MSTATGEVIRMMNYVDDIAATLRRINANQPPDDVYRDHVGIHPQKQDGYVYAGIPVLRGRLTADQMRHRGTDGQPEPEQREGAQES